MKDEHNINSDYLTTYTCTMEERALTPNQLIWSLEVVENNLTFHLTKAPNRFHRLMQRIFLGFKWKKL